MLITEDEVELIKYRTKSRMVRLTEDEERMLIEMGDINISETLRSCIRLMYRKWRSVCQNEIQEDVCQNEIQEDVCQNEIQEDVCQNEIQIGVQEDVEEEKPAEIDESAARLAPGSTAEEKPAESAPVKLIKGVKDQDRYNHNRKVYDSYIGELRKIAKPEGGSRVKELLEGEKNKDEKGNIRVTYKLIRGDGEYKLIQIYKSRPERWDKTLEPSFNSNEVPIYFDESDFICDKEFINGWIDYRDED